MDQVLLIPIKNQKESSKEVMIIYVKIKIILQKPKYILLNKNLCKNIIKIINFSISPIII
jgi:hypothetical protein